MRHICIYLATDTGPVIYESVSIIPLQSCGITLIESVMILAKGLGAGLLVDTSAGVVVMELLYLRAGIDKTLELVAFDLLLEQHNRTGVRVAMMIVEK